MGIDAVAVLRIANLAAPPTAFGTHHAVEHRGDATLLSTFNRFEAADPDEHALHLRLLLGAALDAHDDPRGILLFPAVCEPKGTSYDAVVREVSSAGAWAPKVGAGYVPARFSEAPRQPHDALVGELIGAMGREAALELDGSAQVYKMVLVHSPDRRDAIENYRAKLDAITRSMGAEFAQRYDASLQRKAKALRAEGTRALVDWMPSPGRLKPD